MRIVRFHGSERPMERSEMPCSVLLVDDDETVRSSIEMFLDDSGYTVHTACDVDEGLEKMDHYLPDVLLVDLKMPGKGGLHLIREARKRNSATPVIVISGTADIQQAVTATRLGAVEFLEKPFRLDDVQGALQQAVGNGSCQGQMMRVEDGGFRLSGPDWTLIGVSELMKDLFRKVQMVAGSAGSTALVQGESGTGKELVARAIYHLSEHNGDGRFVDVNCAALSESLLEAELFGHEKGAFTGATESRKGLFGAAHQGAIFLDEIGEMPLKLQAKLLRVLEEKAYKPVGSVENVQVDCRVIASTNRDLWQMVEDGEFRRDLFYRLDVFTITVPPLRDRRQDIPVLSAHFLRRLGRACNKRFEGFSDEAMEQLMDYHWPGNVRELRNVIERAVILGSGSTIEAHNVIISRGRGEPEPEPAVETRVESLEELEKRAILKVLRETGWQKTKSAEILGINRTTLWHKIKRYGLEEPS